MSATIATIERVERRVRRGADAVTPKDFCRALWEQRRALADPTTPQGIRTLQLGILLSHFIRQNPSPEGFEIHLEDIAHDEHPRRGLLRASARQVLRMWRARRWTRESDGRLVVRERLRRRAI